jgi:tRNA (uracil-5-)-methyltransferase
VIPLAEALLAFVIESGRPVFDRIANVGTWKFVLVRTTEVGQSLVAVSTFPATVERFIVERVLCAVKSDRGMGKGSSSAPSERSGIHCGTASRIGVRYISKIEEVAGVDAETVLVDCCCGTGVIGLAMARNVKEVVGIDIEEEAINDAKRNAEKNGIANATFLVGKAQMVLPEVLSEKTIDGNKIVCIVDPPREGLRKNCSAGNS